MLSQMKIIKKTPASSDLFIKRRRDIIFEQRFSDLTIKKIVTYFVCLFN